MPTPTLESIRAVGDFATLYQWDLNFIKLPTAVGDTSVGQQLNLRCESAEIPMMTGQSVLVSIRGHRVKQPGIYEYNGVMTLTFVETVDSTVSKFIKNWRELCYQSETGAQAPKRDVEATIQLVRLDRQKRPIWRYELRGCFLEDSQPGTLDGSSSDSLKPSVVLAYDYFLDGP